MIRSVATPVNALVGPATHCHVRFRQPHRKMGPRRPGDIARPRRRSDRIDLAYPLLAQSGHPVLRSTCPLSGVKRTWAGALQMSAFDPKRTTKFALRRANMSRRYPRKEGTAVGGGSARLIDFRHRVEPITQKSRTSAGKL